MFRVLGSLVLIGAAAFAQTMIDLKTQSKSVDFSGASSTRPFKSGTVLPGTCSVGEMFYKTDAPGGSNLYGCTSTNAWTLEGQGVGGLPAMSGHSGQLLSTDGSTALWTGLGGDLGGTPGAATVVQIQGRGVSSSAPQSGQALVWNATNSRWEPQAVAGGGGGISMLAQTGDLLAARTNSTTLTIGGNCSPATPCNVRFGNLVFSVVSSATASITAGTGTAFIYISSSGALTVGHNVTASCSSNCTAQSGVTSFPADSIPLFTWSATSGTWDSNGGADLRAFASTKPVQAGAGITASESSGATVFSTDTTLIGLRTSVPPTSNTTCVTGSWAMDTSYYYLCVASGSWRRAALTSW